MPPTRYSAVAGRVEPLRQRAHLVEDRAQALGDHPARLGAACAAPRTRYGRRALSRRC